MELFFSFAFLCSFLKGVNFDPTFCRATSFREANRKSQKMPPFARTDKCRSFPLPF